MSDSSMLRVERLQKICRVIGATPFLKDGAPISTVFIGPSGTGKSQLILSHLPPEARVINDFTFASLIDILSTSKPLPAWIVVPDFNAVLAHKPHVVQLAMGLMLALMGEGVTEIPGVSGAAKLAIAKAMKSQKRGISIGFISSMTPDIFFQKRGPWRKTGFLRRVVPINYTYGAETSRLIQKSIENGLDGLDYAHQKLRKVPKQRVQLHATYATKISRLSEHMTDHQLVWQVYDGKGVKRFTRAIEFPFTLHKVLRSYVRASALLSRRQAVTAHDFDSLVDFSKFVRYDRPEEL